MKAVIQKVVAAVMPVYRGSKFYPGTIWDHVSHVARFARNFAARTQANQFVAEAGGWLHDLGAAMYGRKDHHITGAREAVVVLLESDCPLELIGPIIDCVYSHRGSQRMPLRTLEAKCVAAGDAMDHFTRLNELWRAQINNRTVMEAYRRVSEELQTDWEKIDPEIRALLGERVYDNARQQLLGIASQDGDHSPRKGRKRSVSRR